MLAPSPPFSQTLATTLKYCIRRHRKPQHAAELSQEASALQPVLAREGFIESAAGGGRQLCRLRLAPGTACAEPGHPSQTGVHQFGAKCMQEVHLPSPCACTRRPQCSLKYCQAKPAPP